MLIFYYACLWLIFLSMTISSSYYATNLLLILSRFVHNSKFLRLLLH